MYLPARALILLYPRNPRFYFISLQSEKITGSTNLSPSREDYIRYIDRRGVQFSVFSFPLSENSIDNSSHDSTFRIFSFHEVCEFSFLQEASSIQIYRICIQKPRACFTRFDHRGFLFFASSLVSKQGRNKWRRITLAGGNEDEEDVHHLGGKDAHLPFLDLFPSLYRDTIVYIPGNRNPRSEKSFKRSPRRMDRNDSYCLMETVDLDVS